MNDNTKLGHVQPFVAIFFTRNHETGAIVSRHIHSGCLVQLGKLDKIYGPFDPKVELWLLYETEARRIGVEEEMIQSVKRDWDDFHGVDRAPAYGKVKT